ncbi:MAG: ABC transporter substrate-binding protein [Bacteroidales bacterium]
MKSLFTLIFVILMFGSCDNGTTSRESVNNLYARRFEIKDYDNFSIARIIDPWQKSQGRKMEYILKEKNQKIPDSLDNIPVIELPVKRVVVFSTTHIGFISALGHQNTIMGVSGSQYVCDSLVRKGIENKEVYEIGFSPNVNYERILSLSPDLVFLYGIESSVAGIASRLQSTGIPVILIAEYLENNPLGKLEWIKVFGKIYQEELRADSIFNTAREEYEKLVSVTDEIDFKPKVLVGLPWKDTWYMSGGNSVTSRYITDAGGRYLWEDNKSTEFIPLSLEAAMMKAIEADVWINTGSARSLEEIANRDSRFQTLNVFQAGNLYNNDLLFYPTGGNDFWEKGVVEPHVILKDMIKIFHPERNDSHDFVYYRKLE